MIFLCVIIEEFALLNFANTFNAVTRWANTSIDKNTYTEFINPTLSVSPLFLQQSQAKRSHTFLLCIALISTLLAIKKERSRFAYFICTIFYKCLISPSHLLRNYGKSSHTRCISYSQAIISYVYIYFLSLLAKSAQSPFLCFPLFNLLNILLNDIFH